MVRIAAIDQGTTSTRCLVLDEAGTQEIVARRTHETRHPRAGWCEQDPKDLLRSVELCLDAAGRVDAIGLANQGESCLAWSAATGEPLTPVLTWQDSRTSDVTGRLGAEGHAPRVEAISGLPLDPYFSASKLGWMLRTVPEVQAALRKGDLRLGTTDAYFLDRLAGTFATDASTASRTGLMHLDTCAWDEDLCALFGVPIAALPEIRTTTAGFGAIGGTPVAAAIVDQQAALFGHGCRSAGALKITLGTGAFLLAVAGERPAAGTLSGLLPTVAWDLGDGPVYAVDAGVYDVGSAIDWAVSAGYASGIRDFDGFERPPAIARGICFVPAFSGLAAPWWERDARPILTGFDYASTIADFRQALLEGIALLLAGLIRKVRDVTGGSDVISIDGGLSQNAYFAQFLADCSGETVVATASAELTALGCALLASGWNGTPLAPPPLARRQFAPRDAPREEWRRRFDTAVLKARGH